MLLRRRAGGFGLSRIDELAAFGAFGLVMVRLPGRSISVTSRSPKSYLYSLHCSSLLGLPFVFLNIELVKPKKRNYNGDCR